MNLSEVSIYTGGYDFFSTVENERKSKWNFDRSRITTGIDNVWRSNLSVVDMSIDAAKKLKKLPREVDFCIFVTQSHDFILPPASVAFAHKVGLDSRFNIDINSGCSGFVAALRLVRDFFFNTDVSRGVVVTADKYSKYLSEHDRATNMVFSDGASVCYFERGGCRFLHETHGYRFEEEPSLRVEINSKGEIGAYSMNGPAVFNYATTIAPAMYSKMVKDLNEPIVDYYLFHQASKVVLDKITEAICLDPSKVLTNYKVRGNLTSSSIPYLIHDNFELLSGKKNLYLSGFGVGLSHGALLVNGLI